MMDDKKRMFATFYQSNPKSMSNKLSTGFGHASLYGGFGNAEENWSDEDEEEDERDEED